MRTLALLVFCLTGTVSLAGSIPATESNPEGVWQGATSARQRTSTQVGTPTRFLELDSGGSGGMFGKGDIRKSLHDVFFWNEKLGWTCGYGGVFETEDGGLTWTRMKPRGGWYQVEMSGPDEVWLLEGKHPGGPGKAWLWHTTDGGKSWEEALRGKLAHYWDLYCRGKERWALCGGYPSWRSADGGRTWRQVNLGGLAAGAYKVAIPADVHTKQGFVVYLMADRIENGQRLPVLLKSDNGGGQWRRLPLPEDLPGPAWQWRIFFADSWHGWLGLPTGRILRTEDGGSTWTDTRLPGAPRLVTALWFDLLGRGFAAVWNGFDQGRGRPHSGPALFETRDAGASWQVVLKGQKQVNAICGRGPDRVWAVGDVPGFVPNDFVAILQQRSNR